MATCPIDQAQAYGAWIHGLGQHVALALVEVEHQRHLTGNIRVHAHGGDDSAAARDRRQFAHHLRARHDAAIAQGLQLNAQLLAFGGGLMGQVAQRTGELHHDVGLIVVIGQFHDVDEATRAGGLRDGTAAGRHARGQQHHPPCGRSPSA